MPLTDTYIRSVKPNGKPKKHFDGGGLFLFVTVSGSKLWRMAYRFDQKSKLLSFGEYTLCQFWSVMAYHQAQSEGGGLFATLKRNGLTIRAHICRKCLVINHFLIRGPMG